MTRIRNVNMRRIRVHAHDLLLYGRCVIGQEDTVAERLRHLRLTIDTRETTLCRILRNQDIRLDEDIALVDRVETMCDLACLLDHRHLVLTGWYGGRLERCDIGGLRYRIGEESGWKAGNIVILRLAAVKATHEHLGLDGRVSGQTLGSYEVHIVERQCVQCRDAGLNADKGLIRIDTCGEIIEGDLDDVITYLLRVIPVIGQGLIVRDEDVDLVELTRVLKLYSPLERTHKVS